MTDTPMADEWVRERAAALHAELLLLPMKCDPDAGNMTAMMHVTFSAALQEAIERTRAEERATAEVLKRNLFHFELGRDSILARLTNPGEAIVEAVVEVLSRYDNEFFDGNETWAERILSALAATLDQEG